MVEWLKWELRTQAEPPSHLTPTTGPPTPRDDPQTPGRPPHSPPGITSHPGPLHLGPTHLGPPPLTPQAEGPATRADLLTPHPGIPPTPS